MIDIELPMTMSVLVALATLGAIAFGIWDRNRIWAASVAVACLTVAFPLHIAGIRPFMDITGVIVIGTLLLALVWHDLRGPGERVE